MNWRHQAACATPENLETFDATFHNVGKGNLINQEAILVCLRCPVLLACREEAVAEELHYGVRGGLTADQRIALAKHRRKATA